MTPSLRLCVLGNSHAAALKTGWDDIKSGFMQCQLTFFASRGIGLAGLVLNGCRLVPSSPECLKDIAFTSAGKDAIGLDEYDVFVVYGLGLGLPRFDQRYSSAVVGEGRADLLMRSLNTRIARLIRSASAAPICIGHAPQSATVDDRKTANNELTYYEVLERMQQAINIENAHLIAQPAESLVNGWHTKAKYSKGSTRLDVGDHISNEVHPNSDMMHMNAEFGALYLRSLFQQLKDCPHELAHRTSRTFGQRGQQVHQRTRISVRT
jgi:hypothetical protein